VILMSRVGEEFHHAVLGLAFGAGLVSHE
jgi:hypothetical protein